MSRLACSPRAFFPRPLTRALVVLTALAAGCASLPPAQTAKDLQQIVGQWKGHGGDGTAVVLTVSEAGRYRAVTATGREFVGQVQVDQGRFRFKSETTKLDGTWTLYEGDGKKILKTRTDDGSITGEYNYAKP